ncbi:hypothetical protein BYT27DRAFT_7026043, partial [Phlegmacium glaucopus]
SIEPVALWLNTFRSTTTQMSATKKPMLPTTHAIFCGLQDEIWKIIQTLPPSTSPHLIKGLMDAHRKLSDYYYTFNQSPFYIWSLCECLLNECLTMIL